MGIDARMFVRIKGRENWLDPDKELATAVALSRVVGAGHFIITKALGDDFPFEKHHALSVLETLSQSEASDYGVEDLVGNVVYFQDGDPIVADPDEQFIAVHLMTRYYGEDYARGDWPTIRTVAEWLELRFPKGEVWYGGDSSGVCAEPLTRARRDQINRYFLTRGHSQYRGGWPSFEGANARPTCRCCEQPMESCGGGQGETFWYCDGCDGRAKSSGETVTFLAPREDFFTPTKTEDSPR